MGGFSPPGIDNVLALQDGVGTITYLTRDHLGSIREQTSAAGVVTLRRDYDPWGNLTTGGTTNGLAFTGREWDPEVSLHYYRARYYKASAAVFLSEDQLRGSARASRYAYVEGSPPNLTDPSGHFTVRTNSRDFNKAVTAAAQTIVDEIVTSPGGCACISWFIQHGSDLIELVAFGGRPFFTYNKTSGASLPGETTLPDDIAMDYTLAMEKSSCRFAQDIMHEFAHIALQPGPEPLPQDYVDACSVGCISVPPGKAYGNSASR